MPAPIIPLLMLVAAALFSSVSIALAEDFTLRQPIACELGKDCFIQQFVDHDTGPKARDFTCGALSYDGHKGTDFGLPSFSAMRSGVDVLAAASGRVVAFRDGMPDTGADNTPPDQLKNRECGNGVVIRHPGGYETQYCHLKSGSIIVKKGQTIQTGDILGEVGFSGRTQFPHVHLSVRRHGQVIDPFAIEHLDECGGVSTGIWAEPPQYAAGGFLSAGFADSVPDYQVIKDGSAARSELPNTAPALVLWGYAFGGQGGDEVTFSITGPNGPFANSSHSLDRNKAQFFRATGKKTRNGLPAGRYLGEMTILRGGKVIDRITTQTLVK